jgi:hypothetical protein
LLVTYFASDKCKEDRHIQTVAAVKPERKKETNKQTNQQINKQTNK